MTASRTPGGARDLADRRPFHGWRMVGYASIALAMTAPGQTAGVPHTTPVARIGHGGQVGHQPLLGWGGLVKVAQPLGDAGNKR